MTVVSTRCAQGSPCWVSLMAHDLGTARDYYGALLGWEFTSASSRLGPYVRAARGGEPVAWIAAVPPGMSSPVEWTTYFAADSTDEIAQRIRACGGTVAVGPLQVGGAGRLAIASDPYGAVFGIREGLQYRPADQSGRRTGVPTRYELVTPESSRAAAFYGSVFGRTVEWTGSSAPGGADAVLRGADRVIAAIRRAAGPLADPPRWHTSFAVADADEAAERAVKLGGQLLAAPQDTAYGRVVRLGDREGGRFSVVEPWWSGPLRGIGHRDHHRPGTCR